MTTKPKVFIGSSREAIQYVDAIHDRLSYVAEITPWHAGVFRGNDYPMEALERQLDSNDYAIFVLSPDDVVNMRGKVLFIPRDNTLFEMGLFWGKLRRNRVYFLIPDSVPNMRDGQEVEGYHLASDFDGLTVLNYEANRSDKNFKASVNRASGEILNNINVYKRYDDPQKRLRTLKNVLRFYRDFSKDIMLRQTTHYDKLIDGVRNSYDASGVNCRVIGAAIWYADSDSISQKSGNVGRGRSYSINANGNLLEGEPRKLVVDAYLDSRFTFIQIAADIENEYLLCYPISNNHVISIHITCDSYIQEIDFDKLESDNQELISILHHLFGGDFG